MGGVARLTAQGIQSPSLSVSDESLSCTLELVKRIKLSEKRLSRSKLLC